VIDIAARRVTGGVPVGGEPEGTAVSPDGKLVIQASETASMAHVIDAATRKVIDNLMVDTRPRYIAFTPDGSRFWVSSEVRATVTVFDTATRRRIGKINFTQLLPGDRPDGENLQAVGIVFTRAGDRAFVALGRGKLVAEIDPKTLALVRSFPVGWRAWHLALSPDERYLYTANGLSSDVTAIDLVHDRVIDRVHVDGRPWGIVVL
jgi:YVTN family beta-propeller protein